MQYKECVQSRNEHQNTIFVRLKMPFFSLKDQKTHKEWSSQPDNLNSTIISWSWAFHCCGSLGCRGLTANKWTTKLQAVTSHSKGIRKSDQLHLCKSRRGRGGGGKTTTESSRRKSAKQQKFLAITSSYYSHNTQAIPVHSDVLCKDILQLLRIETT